MLDFSMTFPLDRKLWHLLLAVCTLSMTEAAVTGHCYSSLPIEIKGGLCNGTKFPIDTCVPSDELTVEQVLQSSADKSKFFELSTNDCLDLTAGAGSSGFLAAAAYLNAATVCPQIGGTSNATGWCSVGMGGAFCDYLQASAWTTNCDSYGWDDRAAMGLCVANTEVRGEMAEYVPDGKLCCEGWKTITGAELGLADLIWVSPGSVASNYLGNVSLPHKWTPLCTGVDESKFEKFKEDMKSSGACSNNRDRCVPLNLFGSVSDEIRSGVGAVFLLIAFGGCLVFYFCCGPSFRQVKERKVMRDYEKQLQHAVSQQHKRTQGDTTINVDHIAPPDGNVGPFRTELAVSLLCYAIIFTLVSVAISFLSGNFDALGALLLVFILVGPITFSAAIWCGCCGGCGLRRPRAAVLPPIAVLIENEEILEGRNLSEAELHKSSWLEFVGFLFLPVHVVEDLVTPPTVTSWHRAARSLTRPRTFFFFHVDTLSFNYPPRTCMRNDD
jgi:hypothetical protein